MNICDGIGTELTRRGLLQAWDAVPFLCNRRGVSRIGASKCEYNARLSMQPGLMEAVLPSRRHPIFAHAPVVPARVTAKPPHGASQA